MAGSLKNAANAYKEGALEACILYCQEAMQSDPKNYNALLLAGRAHMDGGQYVEASKMLNRAHNLAPEKADPIKGLQEVARQSGDVLHYCRYAEMLFRVQEEVQAHESVVKLADDLHHSVKEASDGVYIAKTLLLALQGPAKDLNARKRDSLYKTCLNTVSNVMKGRHSSEKLATGISVLEQLAVDPAALFLRERAIDALLHAYSTMGVAGDLQLVQWSRSALKDSGASRKVSTALINALDRLRSVAWDPRAVATAADTLHALPSYQCAKHAAAIGMVQRAATDPDVWGPDVYAKHIVTASAALPTRFHKDMPCSRQTARALSQLLLGAWVDALDGAARCEEVIQARNKRVAAHAEAERSLAAAVVDLEADLEIPRLIRTRAMVGIRRYNDAISEAKRCLGGTSSIVSKVGHLMALSDALRGSGDAERAATAAAKAVSVANAGSAGAALVEEIRNRGCEGDVQGFGAAMGEAMAAAVACWEGMGRCRALMGEGKHAEAARVLRGSLAACGKVAESLRAARSAAVASSSQCPAMWQAMLAASTYLPGPSTQATVKSLLGSALLRLRQSLIVSGDEASAAKADTVLQHARNVMEAAAAVPGPSQATTLSWIATQVEAEGDPAAARRMYQKALGADPACAVAGRRLCAMLHGMPGGGDLVRRLCTEMARRSAQAAWAHVVLGQIDEARGESRDAIGHYQRALRCNEEDAEVWESLGRAYVGQGRAEAASKAFLRCTELQPTWAFPRVMLGALALEEGDPDAAAEHHRQALALDRRCIPALLGIAQALLAASQRHMASGAPSVAAAELHRAKAAARAACAADGTVASAWKTLGDAKLSHWHVPLASHGPQTSHDDDSGSAAALLSQGHAVSAILETHSSRIAEVAGARRAYAKALHANPGHAGNRAAILGDIGASFFAEAELWRRKAGAGEGMVEALMYGCRRALQGALGARPTSPSLWLAMGSCAESHAAKENALSRALQLDPQNAPAWVALGKLYREGGRKDLAEQCWERARSHDPIYAPVWEAMSAAAEEDGATAEGQTAFDCAKHALVMGISAEGLLRVVNGAVQRGMAADGHILAAATRCTELEEWNPAAHNALGLAQEARGLHGAALASYAKAMALLSDAEGRHLAVRFRVGGARSQAPLGAVQKNIARLLTRIGRAPDAADLFSVIAKDGGLEGDPWSAAMAGIARCRARRGPDGVEQAVESLRGAVSAMQGDADPVEFAQLVSLLVAALAAQGSVEEAWAATFEVASKPPVDGDKARMAEWAAAMQRAYEVLIAAATANQPEIASTVVDSATQWARVASAGLADTPDRRGPQHSLSLDPALRVAVGASLAAASVAASSGRPDRARAAVAQAVHLAPWGEGPRVAAGILCGCSPVAPLHSGSCASSAPGQRTPRAPPGVEDVAAVGDGGVAVGSGGWAGEDVRNMVGVGREALGSQERSWVAQVASAMIRLHHAVPWEATVGQLARDLRSRCRQLQSGHS